MKEKITARLKEAKEDPRLVVITAIELLFSFIIMLSIYFYLDPKRNIPGMPEIPFPLNLIAFVVMLALLIYIYTMTILYRQEREDKKKTKK
ncbi:MAG: hypothetical protein AB1467_04170 [Candidatus Diapherotrites archaeon]